MTHTGNSLESMETEENIMPERVEDLHDLQAVAQALRDTFVSFNLEVNVDECDIYEYATNYTLTVPDQATLKPIMGEVYERIASALGTRAFTLRAPVDGTEDQVLVILSIQQELPEDNSLFAWVKSLFIDKDDDFA